MKPSHTVTVAANQHPVAGGGRPVMLQILGNTNAVHNPGSVRVNNSAGTTTQPTVKVLPCMIASYSPSPNLLNQGVLFGAL